MQPYTIKKHFALAGVQVTASHNPKEDNGYKVFWENGAQVLHWAETANPMRILLGNEKYIGIDTSKSRELIIPRSIEYASRDVHQ